MRFKCEYSCGEIACPKCGSKKTSSHWGKRSAYYRFYCGDCFYEFEASPKPFVGIEVLKGLSI